MTKDADIGAPDPVFDPELIVGAVAPALSLPIAEAHRPGVLAFLGVARNMARLVFAVPLHADGLELAPVFTPGAEDGEAER